jgi:signal transduction histidine kinase
MGRLRWRELFAAEPVFVHGDPARLNQVFLNLLQNAVEAMNEDGEIQVSVEVRGTRARVEIADSGRDLGLSLRDARHHSG